MRDFILTNGESPFLFFAVFGKPLFILGGGYPDNAFERANKIFVRDLLVFGSALAALGTAHRFDNNELTFFNKLACRVEKIYLSGFFEFDSYDLCHKLSRLHLYR